MCLIKRRRCFISNLSDLACARIFGNEVSPKLIITVKTDGRNLYLKGSGGYFLPLDEPLSETKYFYRQFYVPIVFDRDKEGRVNQLLWAGQYPCKKIRN